MEEIKKNSLKAFILAARPKTLPASITPVIVGCSLAFAYGQFKWIPAMICLVFAVLVQVVSNMANDYFDFVKGTDNEERLGPARACASGWIDPPLMLRVAIVVLIIAIFIGLILVTYGGWNLIWLGLAIAVFAFAYSAGPYPLAYHGWGDVCVLLFYGIVPVGFTFYVQSLVWTLPATVAAFAVGLASINILVVNNYRDRHGDEQSGKKTSVVRWGEKFAESFYLANGLVAVCLCSYFGAEEGLWWATLLPLLYLIPHIQTWKGICEVKEGKGLNKYLGKTALNVLIFGCLLSLGLIIG